ncbi:MAG TPA: hypothetical protein ENF21_04955 [Bacteroidetes bacterium]|nr:hypothetical protein [Bacteroidota bacterium]
MKSPKHTLFWSGGWDSSFRILQLLISAREPVQPYYVYDHRRKSTSYEIEAIRRIITGLKKEFPLAAALMQPVKIINKSRLKKDAQTRQWYEELNRLYTLGIQYEWFARISRQYGIRDLEIGIVRHTEEEIPLFNLDLERNIREEENQYRLTDQPVPPSLKLLENFCFPIIRYSKDDMGTEARKLGFHHLLALSWYCYHPGENGIPCGECKPCQIARISGYEHHFQPSSHKPVREFRFPRFKKDGLLDLST